MFIVQNTPRAQGNMDIIFHFLHRLDLEELITEAKKARDTLSKEVDQLTKKAKIIMAAVKQAETELEAFQVRQRKSVLLTEMNTLLRV